MIFENSKTKSVAVIIHSYAFELFKLKTVSAQWAIIAL